MKLKDILAAIRKKFTYEPEEEEEYFKMPFKYASIFTTYHDYSKVTDEDVEKLYAFLDSLENCEEK